MPEMNMQTIQKEFDSIGKQKISYNASGEGQSPSSIKDKCMKMLQPPCVYFIALFFFVIAGLYYNKPCFILSNDIDPKTNKQKIDFKMLGMYSAVITALISFGIHPYISKTKTKTE